MPKSRKSKHAWGREFWNQVERTDSPWTTSCPTEDRLTFELKVEAMVRSSIPEDLDRLKTSYGRFNWTQPFENAVCNLYDAFVAALYCGESLDAGDVTGQLHALDSRHPETGQLYASKAVVLPFPEQQLENFVRELKYAAFITAWQFRWKHHRFLKSLPRRVESELDVELLEVAMREVLDRLREPTRSQAGSAEST